MMRCMFIRCALLGILLWTCPLWAKVPATTAADHPPAAEAATVPGTVVTEHQIEIDGRILRYRATAGDLTLHDSNDKPTAHFFFVAYDKIPQGTMRQRPIIFLFNGGPGAASVWLHLGTVGPKRVKLGEMGQAPAPPYELVDNEQTWLEAADLVFIDPVGTGYSRAAEGKNAEDFFGVQQDVKSVGQFIRLYTTQYQRWASPKFLAGESYGTTRAAALSNYLHDSDGLDLNGIILISSVLNFQTIQFGNGNDLPYALYLPTYAATAWYHHKLADELQKLPLKELVSRVQEWTLNDYFKILAQGSGLSRNERDAAADQLARYTGLGTDLIEQANLRIEPRLFRKHLLGDHQLIGRMDTRLEGFAPDPTSPWGEYDPGMDRYVGVYGGAFNNYIRQQLNYKSDLPYVVLSQKAHWKLQGEHPGYLDVSDDLQSAMLSNPHLRVFVACGYYDLATPFFASDYTVDHLNVGPELRRNIVEKYYPGGHMMYHNPPARVQLSHDIAAFVQSAAGSGAPTTQQDGGSGKDAPPR